MDPITYDHYFKTALRAYHGFPPAKYGITDEQVEEFDRKTGGRGRRHIELGIAFREWKEALREMFKMPI